MIACYVCGSELAEDAKSCPVCGTSVEASPPPALPAPSATSPAATEPVASGARACPACGKRYDAAYTDSFCACGTALVADTTLDPDIDLEPARAPAELPLQQAEQPSPPEPEESVAGV